MKKEPAVRAALSKMYRSGKNTGVMHDMKCTGAMHPLSSDVIKVVPPPLLQPSSVQLRTVCAMRWLRKTSMVCARSVIHDIWSFCTYGADTHNTSHTHTKVLHCNAAYTLHQAVLFHKVSFSPQRESVT